MSGVAAVFSKADLKALVGGVVDVVLVDCRASAGDRGGGSFRWDGSDLSAFVSIDSDEGLYVAPNSEDGSSGAWVRDHEAGEVHAAWFGSLATGFGATVNSAIQTMRALNVFWSGRIVIEPGSYAQNDETIVILRGMMVGAQSPATLTIAQSNNRNIVIGGGSETVRDAWLINAQINAQNGATSPCVLFDRATYSGIEGVLFANVDDAAVEIGTSANPSACSGITLRRSQAVLDGSGAAGARLLGGSLWLDDWNVQGGATLQQAWLDVPNTGPVDGLYSVGVNGGTGDCDYWLKWAGSANLVNVMFNPVGADRCSRGAIYLAPQSGAHASNLQFLDGHFGGIGGGAINHPVIHFDVPAGSSIAGVRMEGQIADGNAEAIKFEGAGAVTDVTWDGIIRDCGRAAANTYAAIRDATTNGVMRLRLHGVIDNSPSSYSYGVQIDTLGAGTTRETVCQLSINGAASAALRLGGVNFSAGLPSLALQDANNVAIAGGSATGLHVIGGTSYGAVNDDTAFYTQLANGQFGTFLVRTSGVEWGLIAFDYVGTPGISAMVAHPDVNVMLGTGSLNGTTGPDGKLNVSIDTDFKVYVENRLGATRLITALPVL